MLLLDLSHTSHSRARTGVQRVALALRRALAATTAITEITHDYHAGEWRPLQLWERASLDAPPVPARKRGTSWPLSAQVRGWWRRRQRGSGNTAVRDLPSTASAIVFPEIFTPRASAAFGALFGQVDAPRIAIFHDAIPLRLPEFSPPSTVGRFPRYLDELRAFDGIAAVSEDSRQSLLDYWSWAGLSPHPPVIALPLGTDHLPTNRTANAEAPITDRPLILCVGSLEGRKNHLTLLQAAERLWADGLDFELQLIGGLQRETGAAAHALLQRLQAAGRPLLYDGWLSDSDLNDAYQRCAFTVYPSLLEGFGLPIWESLLHGKPCVCSDRGAIAETARGGGCLTTSTSDVAALTASIHTLLTSPERLAQLTTVARARSPRSWRTYADELLTWADTMSTSRRMSAI